MLPLTVLAMIPIVSLTVLDAVTDNSNYVTVTDSSNYVAMTVLAMLLRTHQCCRWQVLRFIASHCQRLSTCDLTRQWYRRWTRLLRFITCRHNERSYRMLVGKPERRRCMLRAVERSCRLVIAGSSAKVMRRLRMIHHGRIILTDGILSDGRSDGIICTVHKPGVAWRSCWCCQHCLICHNNQSIMHCQIYTLKIETCESEIFVRIESRI